ncbi:hypothetical protein [Microbacterium kunmingense]|uniref:hypothetical protein n=1 Tax=Microbacterium kunmingense TaxID=2915939 RepID=UPI003D7539FB
MITGTDLVDSGATVRLSVARERHRDAYDARVSPASDGSIGASAGDCVCLGVGE